MLLALWLSGTQVVVSLSYLNPGAAFRLSLVVFMTRYIFLSFMVGCTASNATSTSFSPAPRKPPTPMTSEWILPD